MRHPTDASKLFCFRFTSSCLNRYTTPPWNGHKLGVSQELRITFPPNIRLILFPQLSADSNMHERAGLIDQPEFKRGCFAITRWRGLRWLKAGLRGGAASASDDCLDRVCVWGRLEQTGVPGWVITGNGWNVSQRWRTEPSLGFRSQRFHVCLSWKILTLAHLPETAVKNARSLSELRGSGGLSLRGAAGKRAKLTIRSQEARAGNGLWHRKLEEIHFKSPSWRGF